MNWFNGHCCVSIPPHLFHSKTMHTNSLTSHNQEPKYYDLKYMCARHITTKLKNILKLFHRRAGPVLGVTRAPVAIHAYVQTERRPAQITPLSFQNYSAFLMIKGMCAVRHTWLCLQFFAIIWFYYLYYYYVCVYMWKKFQWLFKNNCTLRFHTNWTPIDKQKPKERMPARLYNVHIRESH